MEKSCIQTKHLNTSHFQKTGSQKQTVHGVMWLFPLRGHISLLGINGAKTYGPLYGKERYRLCKNLDIIKCQIKLWYHAFTHFCLNETSFGRMRSVFKCRHDHVECCFYLRHTPAFTTKYRCMHSLWDLPTNSLQYVSIANIKQTLLHNSFILNTSYNQDFFGIADIPSFIPLIVFALLNQ